jgi:LysM repeat protein
MIPIARGVQSNRVAEKQIAYDSAPEATVRTQSRVVTSNSASHSDKTKIVYGIRRGDTLGQIAEWFNVRATDIRNWNNLPFGRKIRAGATLNIWVSKADALEYAKLNARSFAEKSVAAKKSTKQISQAQDDEVFLYIVRVGDTLEKIARWHGATVRQIQRWNNLGSSRIAPGNKLVIYPSVKKVGSQQEKLVAESKAKSRGTTAQFIYVVRKGDTISQIAQAHDVRESELRLWNSLKPRTKIYAGQELVIRKDAN